MAPSAVTSVLRGSLLFALCVALPALAANQDDDDLAPLGPVKKAPVKKAPVKKAPPVAKKPAPVDDDLAPLVAAKGEVTVKVAGGVSNAVLSIDGHEVGPLPQSVQLLTPGDHSLSVKRVGFAQWVKKVTVVANKPVTVEATLKPLSAVLSVTSDVADAQVLLNGKLVGTAPLRELEVPPGQVELMVTREGFVDEKQKLTLVAGRDYPVVVKFTPSTTRTLVADRPVETSLVPNSTPDSSVTAVTDPGASTPIYQRWYFWAGVAAVVVAAGVGTAVGVSASQPARKRTEGEVCAPGTCDGCIGLACTGGALTGSPMKF
jgi:hypothetical protein